ncbi:MAG: FG-GAP repeat protein, partial [Nitrospinae bacterium]|nr:FG-GAP repeat protein [Nitrospinota bacterium]
FGVIALALSVAAGTFFMGKAYADAPVELFADHPSSVGAGVLGQPDADPTIVRERPVIINLQGLSSVADQTSEGLAPQPISLNLFPDVRLDFVPEKTGKSRDGQFTILTGSISGGKTLINSATFVFGSGVVTGNIRPGWGSVIYQIRVAPSGIQSVQEVDTARFPTELDPVPVTPPAIPDSDATPAPKASPQGLNAPAPVPDDGTTISIMVVYTANARTAAGGTAAMQALVNLGVSETNQGYANSGVTQRITLAHSAEVSYSEGAGSAGFSQALADVRGTSDGNMDNIHTLRNTYTADMVSLWINNSAYCGLAYLMTSPSSTFDSNAFSVVHHSCATGYYSFGHEMGHNLGSHHDTYVAPGNGAFSYSHGYTDTTNRFRTVMAYNDACAAVGVTCARINYWSNPGVNYNAAVTGASNADNALSLNNTVSVAANWRASNSGSGSLTVNISPAEAVTAGAQWRVNSGTWQASGATVSNLSPGSHSVSFNTVAGYTSPANQNVTITDGQTTTATGTYTITSTAITVSATNGTGGSVTPASQDVTSGSTVSFTVTANTGYTRGLRVNGTCPAGYWSSTTYTTGAVTASCTASFTFVLKSAAVTVPGAVTNSATSVAESGVTFNGSVNPKNASTAVVFQYGKTTAYGLKSSKATLTGRVAQSVSAAATGLACATTYHYRVRAANSKGVTNGSDATFTTSACTTPRPVTGAVTNKTQKTVTLNGTVNPRNSTTTAKFQYGTTTAYGSATSVVTLTGSTDQAVTADLTGLACGTVYHFRAWAQNPSGIKKGADVAFKTALCNRPVVATGAAAGVTSTGATLNGTVNPKNDTTTAKFQYGTTTAYGTPTSTVTLTGSTAQAVTRDLTGLTCATTYHFRVVASNSNGATFGSHGMFTTSACADSAADFNIVKAPVSDFDGDGKSDILFRDAVTGQTQAWMMDGVTVTSNLATTLNAGAYTSTSGWQAQGIGDFDGDGKNDLLWRDAQSGQMAVWTMDGVTVVTNETTSVNPGAYASTTGWQAHGIGDFDGDGKSDILWRNAGTGQTAVWFMNGSTVTSSSNTNVNAGAYTSTAGWQVHGVGDFNGDAKSDILWRQIETGMTAIWFMNGASKVGGKYTSVQAGAYTATTGWQIHGVGDFNGDGKADILWRNAESGATVVWFMNGAARTSSSNTSLQAGTYDSTTGWHVQAVGDFNDDGKSDVLLRYAGTGQTFIWLMNGAVAIGDWTSLDAGAYDSTTGLQVLSEETIR